MQKVKHQNTQAKIYKVIGDLINYQSSPKFTKILQEFLKLGFDPQTIIILIYSKTSTPEILFQWIPSSKLEKEFMKLYVNHAYLFDPFYHKAMGSFSQKAYTLREISPDRFFQSEYYKIYIEKTGLIDELGCFSRISKDGVVHLSCSRQLGQKKYNKRIIYRFNELVPVLTPLLKRFATQRNKSTQIRQQPIEQTSLAAYIKNAPDIHLTDREAEISAYILRGHSSLSISLHTGISVGTVKVHRRNIYKKLNINSQSQLFHMLAQFLLRG